MILEALKLTEAAKIARKNAKNATKQKEALFLPIFVSTPSKGENGKRKVRYLDPYLSAVIRHTGYDGRRPYTGLLYCNKCGHYGDVTEDKSCEKCKSSDTATLFSPGSRRYIRKTK